MNSEQTAFKNSDKPVQIWRTFQHWCTVRDQCNPTKSTLRTWLEYNPHVYSGSLSLEDVTDIVWNEPRN